VTVCSRALFYMLARILILAINAYQRTVSRLVGRACRFEPSCSRYAVACLEAHGAFRGGLLSIMRLCKCHPFHPGGYDPPPLPGRLQTRGEVG
jgi:putative membrane protein insertion efficiency factor